MRKTIMDNLSRHSFKEQYWESRKTVIQLARLFFPRNHAFAREVVREQARFLLGSIRPVEGQTWERACAAAAWLIRAQDATPDDGVSHGYFPCDDVPGWATSYPETTGYIIPTLLRFAGLSGDDEYRTRALRMARWEVEIQMSSGAVQGGRVCTPDRQTPCAFNTGMVLDGWVAAYQTSGDRYFYEASRRAADFLLHDLTPEGNFVTNGEFVAKTGSKTYNTLCAWPMYQFGKDVDDSRYQDAAIRIVEAALRQQNPNGWFANNCLTRPEAPLSHTIAYTLQGILEVGALAGRTDFVGAAVLGITPFLSRLPSNGFLYGRYFSDWKPAGLSSCLTGSAQLAVICYRLYELTGHVEYRDAADKIVNFLKALQVVDSSDININGALAGSFPIFGSYMRAGYPNWATKYFLDALMLQVRLGQATSLSSCVSVGSEGMCNLEKSTLSAK